MDQNNWLNVEEVTALFDEVDFVEADVFIQPPENPLLSDEDSGDDGDTDFTHFTGNQLRGAAELKAKQFTNDGIVQVDSTNIYALQSGNESFNVSIEEMRIFMAILFLSGYCIVPRKRMYWELSPDTHHDTVSKAMSRNKFEEILRYFHVCDNANLDVSDKFAKIRPLWNMLNERWLQAYPGDANISIDESMVPYFGRHGAKQHIHGKPIRFGYKVWCVCTRLGYLIQAEPYQGKKTGNTIPEIGVGGSVVIDILSELPQNKTYSIYMDNFFTSLKLLDYLSEKGHDATGTIKANRVENAPLKEATVLKKESRGSYDQLTEQKTGITLVRYNDNNVVTVASTRCGVQPMGKAKRWCRVAKRQVDVQQPACIINYNTYMGGVDQLDQNISTYRIGIRNRKWYWALLAYLLNATMNNAWQLYRLTEPTYFQKYTPQRQRASRVSVTGKERVEESVRLSNSLHVLETNPTQIRCGLCRKNTWKKFEYLRNIKKCRDDKKKIFYLDETWIDSNLTFQRCWQSLEVDGVLPDMNAANRVIVLDIGSQDGFLKGGRLIYKANCSTGEYHGQMNGVITCSTLNRKEYWEKDGITEDAIDEFVIRLGEDDDDSSSSDSSDDPSDPESDEKLAVPLPMDTNTSTENKMFSK
ncbi:piggyBac transposable element-derived protein 3-like [Homalodisca vitripennis]|uniref:piggyBac transposable element-derived protein 3-like n=1 Tax=Homalodisca vitripennis TaxID=197043 RepID=UPI001EE9CEF6|nr:piggyBac transposable element-derived protein 3-like [Homalodisca vitripennis]